MVLPEVELVGTGEFTATATGGRTGLKTGALGEGIVVN